ncbi:MAG: VWA domain-containing protein [Treponema sp.]
MKRLKNCVVVLLFMLSISALYSQSQQQRYADVIVLMDTSGTVLPYYEAINQRVLHSIISKFIRIGDTFHLLSFNAVPRYEMSQQIETEADVSRVVSRFMLLYQLGQSADFLSGINFAAQYMKERTAQQEKILIIISDGIFNPPAASPYRRYTDEQVKTELAKIAASIRTQGWKVYYVKLPFPADAVIKDLDGTFYAGTIDSAGTLNRSETAVSAAGSPTQAAKPGVNGNTSPSHQLSGSGAQNTGNAASSTVSGSTAANTSSSSTQAAAQSVSGTISSVSTHVSNQKSPETAVTQSSYVLNSNNGSVGSETETNTQDTSADPATGAPKEYTDVSKALTENLGIESSTLPDEGPIQFSTATTSLVRIIFPGRIDTSGTSIELPLSLINESEAAAAVSIKGIAITAGTKTEKQLLQNAPVQLQPQEQKNIRLNAMLPQTAAQHEGQQSIDIRIDLEQAGKSFAQASSVLLTVKPAAPAASPYKLSGILRIGFILLILLLLMIFLLFFLRRRSYSAPAQPALRMVQDNSPAQNRTNKPYPLHHGGKKAYPEQRGNKEESLTSLNSFSAKTAAAQAANQKETARQIDYLAQEQNRTIEGRFALLNSNSSSRMNRRPGFSPSEHTAPIKIQSTQSGMTELFVHNQSLSIGKRNIHLMKPGVSLSIGGTKSDAFLIFLVPFPANIAQIRYDGTEYHLTILKPEFFPYEHSNTIRNCIGRNITVVSKKGYHVTFVFRGYEDPKIKLNMILTSINIPSVTKVL